MSLKTEWKAGLLILAVFAACYVLPVESIRFRGAVDESHEGAGRPLSERLQEGEVENHARHSQREEGGGVEPVHGPFEEGVLGDPADGDRFGCALDLDRHFTSSILMLRRETRNAPISPRTVAPKATLPSGCRIRCHRLTSAGYLGSAGSP